MKSLLKITLLTLSFCLAGTALAQTQAPNSDAIRAIQNRVYDGQNEKSVFRAVVGLLQTLKYEHIQADGNTGLITATLPWQQTGDTAGQQAGKAVAGSVAGSIIPFGGLLAPSTKVGAKTRGISVSVEALSAQKTAVRIVMKETEYLTKSGMFSSTQETKENDMTSTPEVYTKIFEELGKEIDARKGRG
jgi:hypothetical protein